MISRRQIARRFRCVSQAGHSDECGHVRRHSVAHRAVSSAQHAKTRDLSVVLRSLVFCVLQRLPAVVVSSIAGPVGRAFASVPSSVACPFRGALARFESTFARPRGVFAGAEARFVRANAGVTETYGPCDAQVPRASISANGGCIASGIRPGPVRGFSRLGPGAGCVGPGSRRDFGVIRAAVIQRATRRVSVATVAIDVGLTVNDRRRYGERHRKGGEKEKCSRTHRPSRGWNERRITDLYGMTPASKKQFDLTSAERSSTIPSARTGAPPVRGKGILPPMQVRQARRSTFLLPVLSGLQAHRRKVP